MVGILKNKGLTWQKKCIARWIDGQRDISVLLLIKSPFNYLCAPVSQPHILSATLMHFQEKVQCDRTPSPTRNQFLCTFIANHRDFLIIRFLVFMFSLSFTDWLGLETRAIYHPFIGVSAPSIGLWSNYNVQKYTVGLCYWTVAGTFPKFTCINLNATIFPSSLSLALTLPISWTL